MENMEESQGTSYRYMAEDRKPHQENFLEVTVSSLNQVSRVMEENIILARGIYKQESMSVIYLLEFRNVSLT